MSSRNSVRAREASEYPNMRAAVRFLPLLAMISGNTLAFYQPQALGNRILSPDNTPHRGISAHQANHGSVPMQGLNSHLSRGPSGPIMPITSKAKTRVQQSSIPMEYPKGRAFPRWPTADRSAYSTRNLAPAQPSIATVPLPQTREMKEFAEKEEAETTKLGISKMDVALFATYFCNMFVINLSVVTIPALAAAGISNPASCASFEAGIASMAPMGGAIGKVVNGFVTQKLGGRRSSCIYLVALAALSIGLSVTRSLSYIGLIMMGYEFLSSIQWTAMADVLDKEHEGSPSLIARGIAIMSLSSYCGALAAKMIGAAMLKTTGCWRTVTRYGALVAVLGSLSMFMGIPNRAHESQSKSIDSSKSQEKSKLETNPVAVLKTILTNRFFWMIGIGHSLGYVVRSSDRLLVPFLHAATGFPRHLCASLTASITVGMVLGLGQGTIFTNLTSVKEKMRMLKNNYFRTIASFTGLSICALNVVNGWFKAPLAMAGIISVLSGIASASISFQFSQVPNLVATNMFPENKAVALSLVDAAGFFVTSQVLAANTRVLGNLGWSASWTFITLFLGLGSSLMMKSIRPVLLQEKASLSRR